MSITIDDIPIVQESTDLLGVYNGTMHLKDIHTEVYYASSKGWFIHVRDRDIPIERVAQGKYYLNIKGIT